MICYQNIVNTIFHKNFWFNIQWTEILERLNFIFMQFLLSICYCFCGGQNLSLCAGLKVPFFNNNASEEKKVRGKTP